MTEKTVCFRCQKPGELLFYKDKYPIVKCVSCGQIFTGLRLTAEARKKFYNDRNYFEKMYGEFKLHPSKIWHRIVARKRLRLIGHFKTKGKLLDIGCGYGVFLQVAKQKGWEVFGVELSQSAVKYCQTVYNLNIFNGEIEDSNFPDQFFDVITGWDILEHIPDPPPFLKAIRRLIKKDGILALSLPNIESLVAKFSGSKWWTLLPEEHLWHFSPETLTRLLHEQKYEIFLMAKRPFSGPNFTRIDGMVVFARPLP
ncbi:MAG: class I SAM-dependent methyltransferase [candidate division WOR-3 bacterium]